MNFKKPSNALLSIGILLMLAISQSAWSASARVINAEIADTLQSFYGQVKDGKHLIAKSAGALIFPSVLKAGFVVGGEYGEGALLIKGNPVAYYSTAAASIGLQLGAQKKSIIILFMEQDALNKFRESSGWKIGVDASVALIKVGVGGAIDTDKINKPIIAFVLGQKGLMYNLSLEGAKVTKIKR